MAKITSVTVAFLGAVAGTTGLAAIMATGCSNSTTSETADSGTDTSTTQNDATPGDATTNGDTGTKNDSATSGEAATSEAGDGGDAAALGCTTTLLNVRTAPESDAGAADAKADGEGGGPVLVTGFDKTADAAASVEIAGWKAQVDNALTTDGGIYESTVAYSAVGRTCPGSVALTVPFTEYGDAAVLQKVELNYNYNANAGGYPLWTSFTKLHYWVKAAFEGTDGGALLGLDATATDLKGLAYNGSYAQWANYHSTADGLPIPDTSLNDWQEVVIDLTDATFADGGTITPSGAGCSTGNACQFASILAVGGKADGGAPTEPATTVLYIDDIWLE
jgi:hypothetical protein